MMDPLGDLFSPNGSLPLSQPQLSSRTKGECPQPLPPPTKKNSSNQLYTQRLDAFLTKYEKKHHLKPFPHEVQIDLPKEWLPLISLLRTEPYRLITTEILHNLSILSKPKVIASNELSPSPLSSLSKDEMACGADRNSKFVEKFEYKGKDETFKILSKRLKHELKRTTMDDSKMVNVYDRNLTGREVIPVNNVDYNGTNSNHTFANSQVGPLIRKKSISLTELKKKIRDAEVDKAKPRCKIETEIEIATSNRIRKASPSPPPLTPRSSLPTRKQEKRKKPLQMPEKSFKYPSPPSSSPQFSGKSKNSPAICERTVFTTESIQSVPIRRPPRALSVSSCETLMRSRIPVATYYFKHESSSILDINKCTTTTIIEDIPTPPRHSSKLPVIEPRNKSNPRTILVEVKKPPALEPSPSSQYLEIYNDNRNDRSDTELKNEQQVQKEDSNSNVNNNGEVLVIIPKFRHSTNPSRKRIPEQTLSPTSSHSGGGDDVAQCLKLVDGLDEGVSEEITRFLELEEDAATKFKRLADYCLNAKKSSHASIAIGDFFGVPYVRPDYLNSLCPTGEGIVSCPRNENHYFM